MYQSYKTKFFPKSVNLDDDLPFSMTNDCLFKLLMQSDMEVLSGLVCSVLHMSMEDIRSIRVLNPIEDGDSVNDKTVILDILIELNTDTIINLEMQVLDKKNWPERSLTYASRSFNNLNKGDDYKKAKNVKCICIMDYTLFRDNAKFTSVYTISDKESGYQYTDKMIFYIVDLTKVYLATDLDKTYKTDEWAKFFKAKKWRDIYMLAEKNPQIDKASHIVFSYADKEEREKIRIMERERNLWEYNRMVKMAEEGQAILAERDTMKEEINAFKEELDSTKEELDSAKEELDSTKEELDSAKEELDSTKEELDKALINNQELLEEIRSLKALLDSKDK